MNKIIVLFFFIISIVGNSLGQNLPSRPNPPKLVNDFIQLLTPSQVSTLEQKLVTYDNKTSTQIVIICVDDLKGLGVNEYGTEILRNWGVGNKGVNNGVVLVVFRSKDNTSRKLAISTGSDIERYLTDYTSKQIIDNEMVPFFKGQDYYGGLDKGIESIMKASEGAYVAPENYNDKETEGGIPLIFIIAIILMFLFIASRNNRNKPGGGYMSRRGYRGWDGPIIFPSSGGGFFGGGGSGGGGGFSSGGGFGGFGGGFGGGGGASGDW